MKAKVPFDKKAMQTFFLANVEKITFAVFVLCFLLIVYGALRRESFPQPPSALMESAGNAESHVNSGRFETAENAAEVDYPAKAREGLNLIQEDAYSFSVRWNAPLFEQTNVRKKPELFAVEQLRGIADRGPVNSEASGGGTKGERWVVLTGVVPKKRQSDAIRVAFGDTINAASPSDLVPAYQGFKVERAEVTDRTTAPDESDWMTVNEEKDSASESRSSPAEGASQELIDPAIADPLPLLVGKTLSAATISHPQLSGPSLEMVSEAPDKYRGKKTTWQGEVSHAEGSRVGFRAVSTEEGGGESGSGGPMFFAVEYGSKEAAQAAQGGAITGIIQSGKIKVKAPAQEVDPDAASPAARADMTLPWLKPHTAPQTPAPAAPAAPKPHGKKPAGTIRPTLGPPARVAAAAADGASGEERIEVPEYVLFRFFDYHVEPGKQYRYRVRLVMNNPNYKVDPRFLDNPKLADDETLETPVTELTAPVSVGPDVHLLVSAVVPPPETKLPSGAFLRISDTLRTVPSGKIMVVKWEEKNGLEAFKIFERLVRGTVLDFPNCTFPEGGAVKAKPAPKKKSSEGEEDSLPAGHEAAAAPVESFPVDYISGAVLVDLSGGTPIPGKDRSLTSPGEILVLDADGSLRVYRELDAKEELDRHLNGPLLGNESTSGRPGTTAARGRTPAAHDSAAR